MPYGKASKKKGKGGRTQQKKSEKSSASEVYEVRWEESALKLLQKIKDNRAQEALLGAGESLGNNPERGKSLGAELDGYKSLRTGPKGRFRVVYRIREQEVRIAAVGIRKKGDRRDIYALTKKLLAQRLV